MLWTGMGPIYSMEIQVLVWIHRCSDKAIVYFYMTPNA